MTNESKPARLTAQSTKELKLAREVLEAVGLTAERVQALLLAESMANYAATTVAECGELVGLTEISNDWLEGSWETAREEQKDATRLMLDVNEEEPTDEGA